MKPSLKSTLTLLILCSLLLGGIGITPVKAATLTVTNSNDSGAGSLRQAITDAASGDTIRFAADMTITLTGGHLSINKNLTIDGSGHSITINGNGARSFWIQSGTIVLESITITGGGGDAGSAVFNRGTISISNSSIVNNSTTGYGSGAVYNDGGSLTITDSVFSGNSIAEYGGAILNNGSMSVSDSTFSNNSSASGGGAIKTNGNTSLEVSGCTFTGNSSGRLGGAIHMENLGGSSQVTIVNSTFSANSAVYDGGAIFNIGGTLIASNNTFSANSAVYHGGAIHTDSSSQVTIMNSTFSANSADIHGGAIYHTHGTLSASNNTFSANSAVYHGGAIYLFSGTLNLFNSTLTGNSAEYGGGLYNNQGSPTIRNSIFWNDSGDEIFDYYFTGPFSVIYSSIVKDGCPTNASCTDVISVNPVLGALAQNGGPTETMALPSGSPALDRASANCPATDQRGVARGSVCDLGAYERSTSFTVLETDPAANATISDLSTITVGFGDNAVHDGSANAANNVSNYLLVRSGEAGFNTLSCADGAVSDDTRISISSATYDIPAMTATLNLASALTDGGYRLFICGTTSVWSVDGVELNGGASDTTVDFTISGSEIQIPVAAELPATGFAPRSAGDGAAILPSQPAASLYSSSGMTLEVPALGLSIPIVGVPQSGDSWDVTWLGDSAGWLAGTAYPTWQGNTVLTGHVWDAWNQPGPFAGLKSLRYGDRFSIHAYGSTYTYEVRENQRYWYDTAASTVFPHEDLDWVTLLTCENWNSFSDGYLYRRAVRAVLVSVE